MGQDMPQLSFDSPEYWHARAAEARAMADGMSEPTPKRIMLGIAQGYDRLAAHAATREARVNRSQSRCVGAEGS